MRTRQERIRLGTVLLAIGVFFIAATVRLFQFQVVWADEYQGRVEKQSGGKVPIPGERGLLYDRHGRLVAKNVSGASLYAHPATAAQTAKVAAYLEKLFHMKKGRAVKEFGLKTNRFRWIKRRLDDRTAQHVAETAPAGLYLREETTRQYPFGTVGKQILGFTNTDNEGLGGVELAQDSMLAGQQGWADIRRDGLRNTFKVKEQALVKPVPGQSLVLTIDWHLQQIVEDELRAAVAKYNAKSGMAVFVDCNTGDILSMAHFDPNEKDPDKPVKLHAVSDLFEPGSAFKAFTAAAVLDAGMVNFTRKTYCEQGQWKVGRRILHDDKKHGDLTFREIIELSSNIGLGKYAIQMNGPELVKTYRAFGFGKRTGCGLPGESAGILADRKTWSDYTVSALAMGHSVAVSALQMTMAMAAVANGGELLQPNLILGRVQENGAVERLASRKVVGNPLKPTSADSLRSFLRGVVERGTAKVANSEFVAIAGKTGTAEIPNLEQGGYFKNRFNASFCGYFPSEAPVIAGIVVLKDPRPITYGGYTSGVAFQKIAERYTVSNPDLFAVSERTFAQGSQRLDNSVASPSLVGRNLRQARAMAEDAGLRLRCPADAGIVVWQFPSPDRVMLANDELLVEVKRKTSEGAIMPDLKGLPIRRASAFLDHMGVEYSIKGRGLVQEQSIEPGQELQTGQECQLVCKES